MSKKPKKDEPRTGRRYWRNSLTGEVFAVELEQKDPTADISTGTITGAAKIADIATACGHTLKALQLNPNDAELVDAGRPDFRPLELPCNDSIHWLQDIGNAESEAGAAESAWEEAHTHAASMKKIFELKVQRVRDLVKEATNPKPLPLLDQQASES